MDNVEDGTYMIEFSSVKYKFAPVILDQVNGRQTAYMYEPVRGDHGRGVLMPIPLVVQPLQLNNYVVAREEFNMFVFLKNPMVLIGLVMFGLVLLLPKLQPQVNPEEMQEIRKGLDQDSGIAATIFKQFLPPVTDSSAGALPSQSPKTSATAKKAK